MNARQTKKRLKERIRVLELDNSTMQRVIANSPTMQELYDLYNKPLKVVHTPLQHYRICKGMAFPNDWSDTVIKQQASEYVAHDHNLLNIIKDHIVIEDRGIAFEFNGAKEVGITFDFWLDERRAE